MPVSVHTCPSLPQQLRQETAASFGRTIAQPYCLTESTLASLPRSQQHVRISQRDPQLLTYLGSTFTRQHAAVRSLPLLRKRSDKGRPPPAAHSVIADMAHSPGPSWGSLSLTETSLVFWLLIDIGFQLAGFAVSVLLKTDKFFDLTGSVSFFVIALASLIYGGSYHGRQIAVTVLVCVWAARLGSYLFKRVLATGKDSRFDEIKGNPLKFFAVWMGQALWVWVTLLPVLILNGSRTDNNFQWSDAVGAVLWAAGFFCEALADYQKSSFKSRPENKGKFISSGLWAFARYPNYFGEMTLWWGIWFLCIAKLRDGYWVSIVSPLFVMLLLFKGSGIPMQEKQQKERWGKDPAFQAWKRNTNLLLPIPKFWASKAGADDDKMQRLATEEQERQSSSEEEGNSRV